MVPEAANDTDAPFVTTSRDAPAGIDCAALNCKTGVVESLPVP